MPLDQVQRYLGHRSIRTTHLYVKTAQRQVDEAGARTSPRLEHALTPLCCICIAVREGFAGQKCSIVRLEEALCRRLCRIWQVGFACRGDVESVVRRRTLTFPIGEVSSTVISLRPMTQDEFQAFLAADIAAYAAEKVRAGNWTPEEAPHRSREVHDRLLPQGVNTSHHHLFTIDLLGNPVGRVWLSTDPTTMGGAGFIYDIFVVEHFRRQGIALQAMLLLEEEAKKLGVARLALHVFGYNSAARSLYEKLGYEVTNVNMHKSLNEQ